MNALGRSLAPHERGLAVRARLADLNPEAVLFDGLDHALVGVAAQFTNPPLAVYDQALILEGLIQDGLDGDEAREHLAYNIEGLYAGPGTPLILQRTDWAWEADGHADGTD